MASSKLMPSSASTSSRKPDLRRNPIVPPDPSRFPDAEISSRDPATASSIDGLFRNSGAGAGAGGTDGTLLNTEITLLDAAGAIAPITGSRKRTAEEVWREIMEGEKRRKVVECKEEAMDEMMTLEDFLVKAGAVDESGLMVEEDEVKVESALSGEEMFALEAVGPYISRQGSLESVGMMGYGDRAVGGRLGKRRTTSLLEPLDKAAQQRQKRMIKNRESAARSRERKQAYQNELEAMAVRLEEENEQLLKEKAERTNERRKMLMEKVIPVEEKRRPVRALRRVNSMPVLMSS